MNNRLSSLIVWATSGVLLALPFTSEIFLWMAILGVVLFLYLIRETRSVVSAFFGGWYVGTIKTGGAIWWFWDTYPLNWIPLESASVQYISIGLYWLVTAAVIGFSFGIFAVLARWCVRHAKSAIYAVPFFWVGAEVLGSLFFSAYSFGPGSDINSDFGFGYLGYVFAPHDLFGFVAVYGGVYAVSFLVVSVSVILYTLFQYNERESAKILLLYIILATGMYLVSFPSAEYTKQGIRVIAVDTAFEVPLLQTQEGHDVKKDAVREAITQALSYAPDVIILPEDSRFTTSFSSVDEAASTYFSLANYSPSILIDSARVTDERGETVLRAYIYDAKTESIHFLDKQYLVPQGEFMPYLHGWFIEKFLEKEAFAAVQRNQSYRPGLFSDHNSSSGSPNILFCFGSAAPRGVKSIYTSASPYVAHLVSHAWFHTPTTLHYQLDGMLVAQARWNNIPIVSATNEAKSKLYMPDGSVVEVDPLEVSEWWQLYEYKL